MGATEVKVVLSGHAKFYGESLVSVSPEVYTITTGLTKDDRLPGRSGRDTVGSRPLLSTSA
jgi:hypothetical protein